MQVRSQLQERQPNKSPLPLGEGQGEGLARQILWLGYARPSYSRANMEKIPDLAGWLNPAGGAAFELALGRTLGDSARGR